MVKTSMELSRLMVFSVTAIVPEFSWLSKRGHFS